MECEESRIGGSEGQEIVMKAGPRKIRLEHVSPTQYAAASTRILLDLIESGNMNAKHLFDYLAYGVKVSELAESYTWISVLHFDRAYRELQACHGFRWGSDASHLATVHLRPRGMQLSGAGRSAQSPAFMRSGESGTRRAPHRADLDISDMGRICRLYNRNRCPFGADCKYRHVCSAPNCGEPHPLALHGKPKNAVARD